MKARRITVAVAVLLALSGCHAGADGDAGDDGGAAAGGIAGTPVHVAPVARRTMREIVQAPVRSDARSKVKLTAPFAGTLTSLGVSEGDSVRAGHAVGRLLARDSEAALVGAEEMLRTATSDEARREAERAVRIAKENRIAAPLLAPSSGVVLARAASAGDRVAEGQEILTVAAKGSATLIASVPQTDLARITAGEPASVELSGGGTIAATVHGVLPMAEANDLTVQVRLDPHLSDETPLGVGLFGIAKIVVASHTDALAVPRAAVVRDDLTGITRVAVVSPENTATWRRVETGIADGEWLEITHGLAAGDRVLVSGQVGLPEGAPLSIEAPGTAP